MKPKASNNYESTNDVYEKFTGYPYLITFENNFYKSVKTIQDGEKKKLVYRYDEERHNLVISTVGGVVVNVEGIYRIGEVVV